MKPVVTFQAADGRAFLTEAECIAYEEQLRKHQWEQWRVAYMFKTELRPQFKAKYVTCTRCDGRGQTGGGFHSLDDPVTCDRCFGSGRVLDYEHGLTIVEAPEVPEDLKLHMAKAWDAYWASKEPKDLPR